MSGIMRFVAALGGGYQAQDEREFQKGREAKADARAQAAEDRAANADTRAEQERRQMAAAAAPVEVQQGAGGVTLPASADNRDVGQPDGPSIENGGLKAGYRVGDTMQATRSGADAAAAAANSTEGVEARQASVLRALGKPLEARQLEAASLSAKATKLQIEKHEQDFINEKLDQRLGQVGTAQELAEHATSLTGKPVTAVLSEDGKKAQLTYTNDKGEQVKYGKEFDNTADGVSREAIGYAKTMKFSDRVAALQHLRESDERKAQDEWTRKHGDATLASQDRHQRVLEGLQGQQVALAGQTLQLARDKYDTDLKQDPLRNLPGGTKLVAAQVGKQLDNYDKAIAQAMSQGQWDPKSPGSMEILDKRDAAQRQLNQIMKPYMNLDAPGAAAPGATAGAAAPGGTARDILLGGPKPAPGAGSAPGAPAAAAPGRVTTAATQAPQAVAAAPQQAAPAPQVDPLVQALNPSGNPSIDAAMAPRVPPLREASQALKTAQAKVVSAGQANNPQGVTQAVQEAQAALNAIDALTKDMEPGMAAKVRQAATM